MNEKQSRADEALECFNSGFYCSQALLTTYCDDPGLDRETALRLSCGLAAGMGRLGSVCGAVTGAYLVIGLMHGNVSPDDKEAVERTFSLVQEFDKRFVAKHGSSNCRELLGVDLLHGDKTIAGERVKAVCPGLVRSAAEILEGLLWPD